MSVLGTGVAAGVAQTGLQSQQVARQRDRRVRDTRDQADRVEQVFEAHIRGLQEDGDDNSAARLVVDTQTANDHEDPVEDALHSEVSQSIRSTEPAEAPPAAKPTDPPVSEAASRGDAAPLYRHLDVTA